MEGIVKDSTNFYNGKTVKVDSVRTVNDGTKDVKVYWVAYGNVYFALREEKLELTEVV